MLIKAFSFKKEAGQISRVLLVLAIIVFVAAVIAYFIIKAAEKPPVEVPVTTTEPIKPKVYELMSDDMKFTFVDAEDMGNMLKGSQSLHPTWEDDITTTERFVKVTVSGKNELGTITIRENSWDLGNIIDSQGRTYEPMKKSTVDSWIGEDYCGAELKPAFKAINCVKIYEISKVSEGLQVEVLTAKKINGNYADSNNRDQKNIQLMDLILTPKIK